MAFRGIGVLFPAGEPDFFPSQHPDRFGALTLPGVLSLGFKRPRREADHSPSPSTEVKKNVAIPPLPHTSSWLVLC
jgi:hypothetical protein